MNKLEKYLTKRSKQYGETRDEALYIMTEGEYWVSDDAKELYIEDMSLDELKKEHQKIKEGKYNLGEYSSEFDAIFDNEIYWKESE